MNSGNDRPMGTPDPEDESDLPIRMLAEQQQEPSPDFWARIRRKIQRRETVAHVASYSCDLPRIVLTELIGVIQHLFLALGGRKEP